MDGDQRDDLQRYAIHEVPPRRRGRAHAWRWQGWDSRVHGSAPVGDANDDATGAPHNPPPLRPRCYPLTAYCAPGMLWLQKCIVGPLAKPKTTLGAGGTARQQRPFLSGTVWKKAVVVVNAPAGGNSVLLRLALDHKDQQLVRHCCCRRHVPHCA